MSFLNYLGNFINTTAYRLSRFKPSSPSTKELPGCKYQFTAGPYPVKKIPSLEIRLPSFEHSDWQWKTLN